MNRVWVGAAVLLQVACGSAGPGRAGRGNDAGSTVDGGSGGPGGRPDDGGTDAGAAGAAADAGAAFRSIRWIRLANRGAGPKEPEGTSEGAGELVGGKLYTFGGFDWSKPCCTPWRHAWVFDPAAAGWPWTRLADMVRG